MNQSVNVSAFISILLFLFDCDFLVIVECDDLSNPANGVVNQPGNSVGTVSSYTCNGGFLLVGDETRTCQKDGEWSGNEPICECKCFSLNFAVFI